MIVLASLGIGVGGCDLGVMVLHMMWAVFLLCMWWECSCSEKVSGTVWELIGEMSSHAARQGTLGHSRRS